MAKIMEWDVPVEGTIYHITCQRRGNQYDFKMEGEPLYRLHADPEQMCEQDVRIGGKRCQVVVYEGVPDVVVDGILMGVDAMEKKNAKRRKIVSILVGVLFVCVGLFAAFTYTAMTVVGQPVVGGFMSVVFGAMFFVVGIILLISARKKENKYGQ
jgi:hypothetical protein